MKPEERASRLLESLQWRDPDASAENADAWYERHRKAIRKIKTNQWEWIRRMGETATTFEEYRKAVDRGLNKKGKQAEPNQEPPERRWKPPELAELLVAELARAAVPDNSARMREFQRHLGALTGSEGARLRELDRVRGARAFVQALVTRIRAGRALEGKEL